VLNNEGIVQKEIQTYLEKGAKKILKENRKVLKEIERRENIAMKEIIQEENERYRRVLYIATYEKI
jgi:CHASE3 domain sensor protein